MGKVFSASKVTMTLGGTTVDSVAIPVHTVSGFSKDMIEYEFSDEIVKESRGAQGDVEYSVVNVENGTLKITLQQTSPSNAFLLNRFSKIKQGEEFGFFVQVKSATGQNELMTSTRALISKAPSIKYGEESDDKIWEIKLDKMKVAIGVA